MSWKRNLQSVGIKCFIDCFDFFNSNLSTNELTEKLPNEYTENAKRTRINNARKIINSDYLLEVLEYIIYIARVDDIIKNKAKKILSKYERQAI